MGYENPWVGRLRPTSWRRRSFASLSPPSHPIQHGQWISGFGFRSCGHAARGDRRQRNRPVGRFGATRGAVGIQALLAGGTSLPFWIGFFRHARAARAWGGGAKKNKVGSGGVSAKRGTAEALPDGGGAGDCGGDGCGCSAVVHHATTALPQTDKKPASGVVATSGFHGGAVAGRRGAGSR